MPKRGASHRPPVGLLAASPGGARINLSAWNAQTCFGTHHWRAADPAPTSNGLRTTGCHELVERNGLCLAFRLTGWKHHLIDRLEASPEITHDREAVMGTILIILLILLLLGSVPSWPYSRNWGYSPSGLLGVILLIVIILAVTGRL